MVSATNFSLQPEIPFRPERASDSAGGKHRPWTRIKRSHWPTFSRKTWLLIGFLCVIWMVPSSVMAVTQEDVDAAFDDRKHQYIDTVATAADLLFVGCEDYCENNGVSLMHRNNLWALLEADLYPEIRHPMIWNMLVGSKRNVPAWEDLDAQIDDKCGFDVVGILEDSKLADPGDKNDNGEPDWYEFLDKTQGLGLSICADWQLVMRLLLQYPHRMTQEEKDDVLDYYVQNFVNNGLQPSNANQQIQAVVGYYLYSEYFDQNLMLQ